MKKTNKNFIYNVIYQLLVFIIPLILTPYISRVLGANNIGIYSYSYSVVYYFMLFTLLGINNYGARSIAKLSDDKEKMSEKFCSIYYMQLIIGCFMFVIYNIFVTLIIKENKSIFYIQNFFLLSAILDINWFYFGIEKFKLTISRNAIIKILSVIFIFVFVKEKTDLWIYTMIMSLSTLISQVYLWFFIHKYIDIKKVTPKKIVENLKPCMVLFIPVIAYSIYKVMDKTMLGAIAGNTDLGYYENAEKIINIPISIITALGTVMLPHMSKVSSSSENKMIEIMNETFELSFSFVIPMIFGLLAVSQKFSIIFFGEEFQESGTIMMLLAPTIFFTAIANVIRTNYLIPNNQDRVYVISTIAGAIVNLIINFILIPRFSYYGACMGTIVAEFTVMLMQILSVKNKINFSKVFKLAVPFLIKGFIMFIGLIVINYIVSNQALCLVLQIVFGVTIYLGLNFKYFINEFFYKNTQCEK